MTEFEWNILVRLIVAHVICDFYIQTDRFCERKNNSDFRGCFLQFLHAFTHALLSYLFVAKWILWQIPLIIYVSHWVIDVIKSHIKKQDSLVVFVVDQILHVGILFLICLFLIPNEGQTVTSCCWNAWIYALGYLLLLKPASLLISLFFKQWEIKNEEMELPKAGRWIGYFERVLVMTFVLLGSYEAIGFLMAAKSIFRFGDLKEKHEIKLTEYVLLGTLMSFTIAVVVAMGTKILLKTTVNSL